MLKEKVLTFWGANSFTVVGVNFFSADFILGVFLMLAEGGGLGTFLTFGGDGVEGFLAAVLIAAAASPTGVIVFDSLRMSEETFAVSCSFCASF
jgi:hypothetical protein